MWEVWEHRRLDRCVRHLPLEVLKRYEKWKLVIRYSGPKGVRAIKGFHDEALRGRWKGHRSSRLGAQYRVIYRLVSKEILVEVIDMTAHNYKRT